MAIVCVNDLALAQYSKTADALILAGESHEDTVVDQAKVALVEQSFNQLSSLWQKGEYTEIISVVENLPVACHYDIRICVYNLYSLWCSDEKVTLGIVIGSLYNFLSASVHVWQSSISGTQKQIWKVFYNSICLLFRKLDSRLKRLDWTGQKLPSDSEQTLSLCDQFKNILTQNYPDAPQELFGSIQSIQETVRQFLTIAKTQDAALQCSKPEFNALEKQDNVSTIAAKQIQSGETCVPYEFPVSNALCELLARMDLLKKLLEKQHSFKAAIVLDDIENKLNEFNPLVYFPELFNDFTYLRASHGGALEPFFNQHKTYQWQVLRELYYSDKNSFLNLPGDQALQKISIGRGNKPRPILNPSLADHDIDGYDEQDVI